MTQTDYLNEILKSRLDPKEWPDKYCRPRVEFRGFSGWYLVFPKSRWFGDDGEYLGACWQDAERYLVRLIG